MKPPKKADEGKLPPKQPKPKAKQPDKLSLLLTMAGISGTTESTTLEFKQTIPQAQRIAKTIAGFANAHGGHIVVGITDKGEKVGVVNPDAEKKRLNEAATLYCNPPIGLQFNEYADGNLLVITALVAEGKQKPYTALHTDGSWRTYIRTGAETVAASRLVEKSLRNEFMPDYEADNNPANAELSPPLDSKEWALLEYLRTNPRITVKGYMQLLNLSYRRARRILVQMTLAGIIRQHDNNKEDYYTLG